MAMPQKFEDYRFNNAIYRMTPNQYDIFFRLASRNVDGVWTDTDWQKFIELVETYASKKTDIRMEEDEF